MKKASLTLLLCTAISLSCEEKKPQDFTDKVITLILENPKGESVEFPNLYNDRIRTIPTGKDEKLILAKKLQARGFKIKSTDRGTLPLAGIRFVSLRLSKENCNCEVTKTYHSTEMVSEYIATERISCY
jgi:hypothetical protein